MAHPLQTVLPGAQPGAETRSPGEGESPYGIPDSSVDDRGGPGVDRSELGDRGHAGAGRWPGRPRPRPGRRRRHGPSSDARSIQGLRHPDAELLPADLRAPVRSGPGRQDPHPFARAVGARRPTDLGVPPSSRRSLPRRRRAYRGGRRVLPGTNPGSPGELAATGEFAEFDTIVAIDTLHAAHHDEASVSAAPRATVPVQHDPARSAAGAPGRRVLPGPDRPGAVPALGAEPEAGRAHRASRTTTAARPRSRGSSSSSSPRRRSDSASYCPATSTSSRTCSRSRSTPCSGRRASA